MRISTLLSALLLCFAPALLAQEYRATLVGVVTDPSAAAVPDAGVSAVNTASGVATSTRTTTDGNYVIPYLLPGTYQILVDKDGFKRFERGPIELRINDRTRVDVMLEIGQASEKVTVVAEAPLLETATSNRGQVIEQRAITDMPLNSHNPFTLMVLASGVQYTGSLFYFRPFDNGAIGSFSINGGRNGINEFQIDGVPNNATSTGTQLAYVPPVEATQEFKVLTNTYDAQYGRTSGGVISVSIKPGTNTLHGAAYEYMRRTGLEANQFQNNANGSPRANRVIDQYGAEIDGPVKLPGLYNGRDRTFFMFSIERYRESTPQPGMGTVPTPEERGGDFSNTRNGRGQLYAIHDPLTVYLNPNYDPRRPVTAANSKYLRQPFAANQVPKSRMEPIALNVIKDIPLPSRPGDEYTHINNWFAPTVTEDTDFQNLIARADHNLRGKWRVYGRWNYNYRDGGRINYYGWETPARQQIHAGRRNDGAVFDAVAVLDPRNILSLRVGYNRFKSLSQFKPIDITSLGLPKSLLSQLQVPNKYPIFNFEGYLSTSLNEWDIQPNETYSAQGNLMKVTGRHSMKFGGEFRLMRQATVPLGNTMGSYTFNRNWTRLTPDYGDPNSGNGMATFLLGYLSSASAAIQAQPYYRWRYPVLFFHDDWQATRRLNLSLGLRWDFESPAVERYDRQVRGIDFNAKTPVEVPGYNLRGGLLYAGVNGVPRGTFDPDWWNFQPRAGVAYKLLQTKPFVFRGGFGRYFLPTTTTNAATNFSRTTDALTSTSEYQPIGLLSNPFPNGLLQPVGSALGLATNLGQSISSNNPRRRMPYVWQFSAGFQYEIRGGLLLDASYVGSRTDQLGTGRSYNYLTLEQLALGTAYLSELVPNPFYNILPSNTSRGTQTTIQRRTLMLAYPHFSGVSLNANSIGYSWYNSAQFKLQQRMRHGLSFLLSYTISKTLEATGYRNDQDKALSREMVSFDRPQRLVLSGIYEFPVGPKRRWLPSGPLSHVVGGWQFNWVFTKQSGTPMGLPSGYYLLGNARLDGPPNFDKWFNTDPAIWVQRPSDTLQTLPGLSPNIRVHTAPQIDASLYRDFRINEKHKVQFKLSAFNAFNTPVFGGPNTSPSSPRFGKVTLNQINLPRSVEIGFRYNF